MTSSTDPARRRFLHAGGMTLALGAVLAGCSGEDEPAPAAQPAPEDPTADPGEPATDTSLLNTALSLEVLAFDTYQAAVDGGLVERREVLDALTLFQQHHAQHRDALVALVAAAGGEPFQTANPVAKVTLVNPGFSEVAEERDLVGLVRDLEQICARLAVHVASIVEAPELRSAVMAMGAVAGRRATYLDLLGDLGSEQLARYPVTNPLPADAVVPD